MRSNFLNTVGLKFCGHPNHLMDLLTLWLLGSTPETLIQGDQSVSSKVLSEGDSVLSSEHSWRTTALIQDNYHVCKQIENWAEGKNTQVSKILITLNMKRCPVSYRWGKCNQVSNETQISCYIGENQSLMIHWTVQGVRNQHTHTPRRGKLVVILESYWQSLWTLKCTSPLIQQFQYRSFFYILSQKSDELFMFNAIHWAKNAVSEKLVDKWWTTAQGVLCSCYKAQYGSVWSNMDRPA